MSRRRLIERIELDKPVKVKGCVCGSDRVYIELEVAYRWNQRNNDYIYRITCKRCGLRGSQEQYRKTINLAVAVWNKGTKNFQDIDRTWLTVDLVYETRWDCMVTPEGVRQAA